MKGDMGNRSRMLFMGFAVRTKGIPGEIPVGRIFLTEKVLSPCVC